MNELIRKLQDIFPEGFKHHISGNSLELDVNTAVSRDEWNERMSGFTRRFDYKPNCWQADDGTYITLWYGEVKYKP